MNTGACPASSFVKSIECLNFRHFATLGISWGSLMLTNRIGIIYLLQDSYFFRCFACQAKRIGLATKTDE
jgi:hypothetical protein